MESPTINAPSGRNVQRRLETGDVAGSKKHDRPLGVRDQGVGVGLGNLLAALGDQLGQLRSGLAFDRGHPGPGNDPALV